MFFIDKYKYLLYTCYILIKEKKLIKKNRFKFKATVSDRGQIFIPKIVQNYFGIKSRDKVVFEVQDDGNIIFKKKTEVK